MEATSWREGMPRMGEANFSAWATKAVLRPAQILMAAPCFLFLATLTAMLFRHPDTPFYPIDRIAFVCLVVGVLGRAVVLRQGIVSNDRLIWPMLGLTTLALASVVEQPYDAETWSLLASKFVVPFGLFHLSGLVFTDEKRLRSFEIFGLVALAYLSFTAIAFLCGLPSLIFPKFILDPTLGFHAGRARGPLLQAVANGVSLNMLALVALHAYRRRSIRGVKMRMLLASVPIAIIATMTRAVWLSFAGTLVAVILISKSRRLRRFYLALLALAALCLVLGLSSTELGCALNDRLQESGPVEYRQAVYTGGWEMFLQRPFLGWGFHQMPGELPRHVRGYQEKVLYPHNTYLELLVEHGVLGLALYVWLMWEMWRLGRGAVPVGEVSGFLNAYFHRLWPILLIVYWVNATVVVMSYQFVNGLLFTMAGMLAAQRRRAAHP
jgi:O-antigen ligase